MMKLLFFCPLWGCEDIPFEVFCKNAVKAGYDGVECSLPFEETLRKQMVDTLRKQELLFIGQYWQSLEKEFEVHIIQQEAHIRNLMTGNPLLINSQTGKDYYNIHENELLINLNQKLSEEYGIPILHETHRGKFSFAAHITKEYLDRNPSIELTLDVSHWCNVHESMLEDQKEALALAISRTKHIHARVGYPQSAQINDPRAPEWNYTIDFHIKCWKQVLLNRKKEGDNILTITPEFGPIPYMQTLPFSRKNVTDQWEANVYMMNLLKKELMP